jgi:phosphonate transport system substrate-binding protein
MKKGSDLLVVLMMVILLLSCGGKEGDVSDQENPIRIGYMICNSLPESQARFEPITAYLSEKLGRRFESVYVNTFDFEDLVKAKKVEFTHTNSILYIIFHKEYGVELIATEERGRHGYQDTGAIISLKKSGIKSFDDMRGKTMVFGPALAPFGYMAQYYVMLTNGFDPEEDLAYYAIPWGSYKHEKVIYGVQFGGYDVGAAPRLDLDQMAEEGKINLDDFHIIAESIPMPYCTVGAMPHVDPDLVLKVKESLLNLKKDETALVNGEVLKVLDSAWIDGFVKVNDSEYDTIRKRLKRCNMAPYRQY